MKFLLLMLALPKNNPIHLYDACFLCCFIFQCDWEKGEAKQRDGGGERERDKEEDLS